MERALRAICLSLPLALLALSAQAHPHHGDPSFFGHFRSHGRIGVRIQPMTEDLRRFFEAPPDQGVLVAQVEEGRPAAAAGLKAGDVLLAAEGETLEGPRQLVRAIRSVPDGESITLSVLRRGELLEISVTPEATGPDFARPEAWEELFTEGMQLGSRELRLKLRELEQRLEQLENRLQEQRKERDGEAT